MSGSKMRWVDRGTADAYEIKVYEIDNVDSLQRRGKAGSKVIPIILYCKIRPVHVV